MISELYLNKAGKIKKKTLEINFIWNGSKLLE